MEKNKFQNGYNDLLAEGNSKSSKQQAASMQQKNLRDTFINIISYYDTNKSF